MWQRCFACHLVFEQLLVRRLVLLTLDTSVILPNFAHVVSGLLTHVLLRNTRDRAHVVRGIEQAATHETTPLALNGFGCVVNGVDPSHDPVQDANTLNHGVTHIVQGALQRRRMAPLHGPEERGETEHSKAQRNRDQEGEAAHCAALASLSELPTTTSELSDIATAAIKGVTRPASASGTAKTL